VFPKADAFDGQAWLITLAEEITPHYSVSSYYANNEHLVLGVTEASTPDDLKDLVRA
jgi:hypothetical protein